MMTIEEVISQLKHLKTYCSGASVEDKTWGKQVQALDVALKMVEKEVPEKPIFKTDYDVSANYYVCPVCGDMVTDKKDEPDYYCSGCGQKLDWEV